MWLRTDRDREKSRLMICENFLLLYKPLQIIKNLVDITSASA